MDFELAVIEYALNPSRLFFIEETCAWLDFQNPIESAENITAPELCSLFINKILPFINTYQLTKDQKHNLKMLDLHPNYIKADQGYKLIDLSEKLLEKKDIFRKGHFGIGEPNIFKGQLQEFIVPNVREKSYMDSTFSPLILQDNQEREKKNVLIMENAGLLSLLVSTNGEMSNRQVFSLPEIRDRLREAKRKYARTGHLCELLTTPLDNLLSRFNKIIELKTLFEQLVTQRPFTK